MIIYQRDNRNQNGIQWTIEAQYEFTSEGDFRSILTEIMEETNV